MKDLTEILKSATPEQVQKAGACKTADELLSFAKTEKIDITSEQAEEILKMINPPCGEVPDEELDNVAGGNDKNKVNCPICNSPNAQINPLAHMISCRDCGYISTQ